MVFSMETPPVSPVDVVAHLGGHGLEEAQDGATMGGDQIQQPHRGAVDHADVAGHLGDVIGCHRLTSVDIGWCQYDCKIWCF